MLAAKNELFTRPSGGYTIARSVRTRASASAYFNRTPAGAGNRKTWTWSAWVKRGTLTSGYPVLFMGGATQTDTGATSIALGVDDKIYIQGYNTNWLVTSQVFRDPSAWYHIVVAMDSTNATANNRLRLYVNGVEVTAFSTRNNLTLNTDYGINQAALHCIAFESVAFGNNYFDGYFAEINFVDGQQLTPSSFGTTNAITGVWQPAKYTGTYGTNGFYLNFSDNSAVTTSSNVGIGKDFSGNGNYWTSNSINVSAYTGTPPNNVNYDSMVDSPTVGSLSSNYCVLNPLDLYAGSVPSNGNLSVTSTTSGGYGTIAVSSGKWYWETVSTTALTNRGAAGVRSTGGADYYALYWSDGQKNIDGTVSAYGASYTTNDVIGVALDLDGGTITFYKNNTSQGAITYSRVGSLFRSFNGVVAGGTTETWNMNFGQRPFSYTPPTGYVALNTYNLPASTITNGAAYMAATLYNGNGGTQSITNTVSGTSFQPDFVWIKTRSASSYHQLVDSVRGVSKVINSNWDGGQSTYTGFSVTAFNSNGVTLVDDAAASYGVNGSTGSPTYVAWQWKKGASSGFDVVSQTLATTGINTITHSLNAVPTMVLAKKTSGTEQWLVYQSSGTTQSQYLGLNTTAAVATSGNLWGSSAFTTSQIYFNGTSGNTYVFYIFAPVAGFSAFGSYTGNGSADGTFVYLGFRPRYVLIKRTDTTSDWWVVDSSRNTSNVVNSILYPDLSATEATGTFYDFLSNGFKCRDSANVNVSGGTYIYACFAENPFKYALAR